MTNFVTVSSQSRWQDTPIQKSILLICEGVSSQPTMLLDLVAKESKSESAANQSHRFSSIIIGFMASLLTLLNPSSSDETKFLSLRCFSDIFLAFFNEAGNNGTKKCNIC